MADKGIGVGICPKHGEYYLDAKDSPCPSCEDAEECRYCGGNCPNEPGDSEYLCDGFAGDIDGLYAEEEQLAGV
jgi:hypothetical protein